MTRLDTITIQEKDAAMAKHFCVFGIKSELDQILCGLSSTLGAFSYQSHCILVCSSVKITADSVYDSPDGSNQKVTEKATVLWVYFLQRVLCIDNSYDIPGAVLVDKCVSVIL